MKIMPPGFQIHLSTAVVLMIGASVILDLNLTDHRENMVGWSYGWPMMCLVKSRIILNDSSTGIFYNWNYRDLIIDVLTTVVLLTTLAVVLEKRIEILARLKKERT